MESREKMITVIWSTIQYSSDTMSFDHIQNIHSSKVVPYLVSAVSWWPVQAGLRSEIDEEVNG